MITGQHKEPRATDLKPLLCQWCCPCFTHRKSFVVHDFLLHRGLSTFGQEVSLKKMKILNQPACWQEYHPPHITIITTDLKGVCQFTYLECTIMSDTKIGKKVNNRLAKVSSAFLQLYKYMLYNKHWKKDMKISILATLLYCSKL